MRSKASLIEQRFREHLQKYHLVKKGDSLLLGLSGGSDSVALLRLLHANRRALGYSLHAAHCNFQLRGRSSLRDAKFSHALSEAFGIPFFTTQYDTMSYAKEQRISIELAARALRYAFFDDLVKKHGFSAVLTAHHKDDHIETILFTLLRSGSLTGLGGIMPLRTDRLTVPLVRPLLPFSKDELLDYLNALEQPFCKDATNFKPDADRNYLRLQAIPRLKKRFGEKVEESLLNLSTQSASLEEFLRPMITPFLDGVEIHEIPQRHRAKTPFCRIPIRRLVEQPLFLRLEIIKHLLIRLHLTPEKHRLLELDHLLFLQNGKERPLGEGIRGVKENDTLCLYRVGVSA